MKKLLILTLVVVVGFTANAQRDNDYRNNDNHPSQNHFRKNDRRELERRIAIINDRYNDRINSIRHQAFLRSREKRRQIKQLERERSMAIERCKNDFARGYADGYHRHR